MKSIEMSLILLLTTPIIVALFFFFKDKSIRKFKAKFEQIEIGIEREKNRKDKK